MIAAELITKVRQIVTIDWTLRESARAKIRLLVKRILNKYGYPPDLQEEGGKVGSGKLEVGSWKLEVESGKLEVGSGGETA